MKCTKNFLFIKKLNVCYAICLTFVIFQQRLYGTLYFNSQNRPDIGFNASSDFAINTSWDKIDTLTNFCRWMSSSEFNTNCHSFWRNQICVMSVYDLLLLSNRHEYFANKFILSYDPVVYQCMEEWYDARVEMTYATSLNLSVYCEQIKRHSSIANC
jgi:hypothetical protein